MEVLDTTIANVALTHIAGSVGAGEDEATYILTSYLVSNAIVLTISGWLANVVGRKRYYMFSVALFTASSVMCAASTSLGMIIFFRVLQGIGGGGLAPVEQSIFADTFPPAKRAIAFSIYGFTIVTAPAIGPALGGWLTDNFSWHWVFLINLPVGLLSLALTSIFITDSAQVKEDRKKLLAKGLQVDWIGFILVAVGFGCLQVMLDRYERDDGFSSDFIVIMTVIAAVALTALVVWELYVPQPVINLRLLKSRAFAISSFLLFTFGFIIQSTTQLIPQLTQQLLAYDSTNAGLTLAVGGLLTVCIMPIVGFVTGRIIQPRYLVGTAFVGIAIALYLTAGLDLDVSFAKASFARAIQVMWLPFVFVPIFRRAVRRRAAGKHQSGFGHYQPDAQPRRQLRCVGRDDRIAARHPAASGLSRRPRNALQRISARPEPDADRGSRAGPGGHPQLSRYLPFSGRCRHLRGAVRVLFAQCRKGEIWCGSRRLPLWLTCLGLAACSVGPDYVPPTAADAPASYDRAAPPVQPSQPVADAVDTEWWQTLNDPLLNQLIAQALAEKPRYPHGDGPVGGKPQPAPHHRRRFLSADQWRRVLYPRKTER